MAKVSRKSTTEAPGNMPAMIEWVMAGLSALMVVLVVGLLIHDAIARDGGRPALVTEVGEMRSMEGGYVVDILVRNLGHATAAAVQVEGTLTLPDGRVETSAADLDYAPAESKRQVTLMFAADPAAGTLAVRPTGYAEP